MIYFDNSATGGFKPSNVIDSSLTTIKYLSANPGRSGHRLSLTGANLIYKTREELSLIFNSDTPERVIFTKNATEALNIAILGTVKEGGHIITTVFEHNSVLRPVYELEKRKKITKTIVEPTNDSTLVEEIKKAITSETYLVIVNQVSNVTGEENDIQKIGELCKKNNLLFLVDGAQSAGHIKIDMKKSYITMLALAGHKGMCGIMGTGALIFNYDVDIQPLMYGGTGTESFSYYQPEYYPECLESGTLNLPGISSLYEGAIYIKKNLSIFSNLLISYTFTLIELLKEVKDITIYSKPNKAGIVSFNLNNYSSEEVADILNKDYDIAVRGGLHCAPLMHKHLNTQETGVVRASLAPQNSIREIRAFVSALKQIQNM